MKGYLAGSGCNAAWAYKWRGDVCTMLPDITWYNPFRGKDLDAHRSGKIKYNPNEIVTRDLRDIEKCDIIIAEYMVKDYPYIGTSMEVKHAGDRNIPVVIWSDILGWHPWLQKYSVAVFPILEECCDYIRGYWGE